MILPKPAETSLHYLKNSSNTRLVSKVTSGTFVNVFYTMKCKNTNREILRRVHRQHCKNYRFIARTSDEQQYDNDGATIDTHVQL